MFFPSGIIGAGISGASTAYFLHELLGSGASIDVYESGEVGGRLSTVSIGGREYEAGGSVIHPGNQYMVNMTKLLGNSHSDTLSSAKFT